MVLSTLFVCLDERIGAQTLQHREAMVDQEVIELPERPEELYQVDAA